MENNNRSFIDETKIKEVFLKAEAIEGRANYARDVHGITICLSEYNSMSDNGWVFEFIIPAPRGSEHISNLRPIHWENGLVKEYDGLVS